MNFPRVPRHSNSILKLFPAVVVLTLACGLLAGIPASAQSDSLSDDRSYDSAEARRLYEAARDDYEQGFLKGAAHTLEDLIKHFPYARHATLARRDLRILYAKIKRRRSEKRARDRRALTVDRKRRAQRITKRRANSRAGADRASKSSTAFERKFTIRRDNKQKPAAAIQAPAPVPVPRYRPKKPRQAGKQSLPRRNVRITIRRPASSAKRSALAGGSASGGQSGLGDQSGLSGISAAKRNEAFKEATVDRVFFGEMDTRLGGKAITVVVAQADWLKLYPGLVITINGHSDEAGSDELNRKVARQRAQAVQELLRSEGVAAKRIRIVVHGRKKRVATCDSAGCVAQNRRVVTDVLSSAR